MIRAGAKFSLLFGCYLLFAGQVSTDEIIAALCCAAAATAVSLTIPLVAERHFGFGGVPWFQLIRQACASLLSDVPRVALRLLRPHLPSGVLQRWPLVGTGDDPHTTARRALVTLANSLAPNSYVVTVLGGRGELLVHRLIPDEPPHDPEWPL